MHTTEIVTYVTWDFEEHCYDGHLEEEARRINTVAFEWVGLATSSITPAWFYVRIPFPSILPLQNSTYWISEANALYNSSKLIRKKKKGKYRGLNLSPRRLNDRYVTKLPPLIIICNYFNFFIYIYHINNVKL